jgi:hypothetical protein
MRGVEFPQKTNAHRGESRFRTAPAARKASGRRLASPNRCPLAVRMDLKQPTVFFAVRTTRAGAARRLRSALASRHAQQREPLRLFWMDDPAAALANA